MQLHLLILKILNVCIFSLQCMLLMVSTTVLIGSIIALGAIVSAKPLDELGYTGWNGIKKYDDSPYTSSSYLGWAMTSILALIIAGVLPIVSWFATYRFSLSSAICIGIFASK